MIKSKEIPIKPQNLLTIRWCRVIFGLAGHVCVSYQVTSACRDKMQHVLRNFFFLHGKMASLTVQDVEVRAPKMICKKKLLCFFRDPFIQKVSFVRCQASVYVLALTCYLTVLTSLAMNCLFFRIG